MQQSLFFIAPTNVTVAPKVVTYNMTYNFTDNSKYCAIYPQTCKDCNKHYVAANCSFTVAVDNCAPGSSLYGTPACTGIDNTAGVYLSGSTLLGNLGIPHQDGMYNAGVLVEQSLTYLLLSYVLGFLVFRDWSRRSMFSDVYNWIKN